MKPRVSDHSKTRPMFRSSAPPALGGTAMVAMGSVQGPVAVRPSDFPRGNRTPVRTRESPRENTPAAMRRLNKCMFLEFDESENRWRDALNRTGRAERPQVQLRPRREEVQRERPHADVRHFQAKPGAHGRDARDGLDAVPMHPPVWENPLVIGLLLAVCPPIGVTLAWSARSIPSSGRVALTMFGAFVMLTATLIACVMLS